MVSPNEMNEWTSWSCHIRLRTKGIKHGLRLNHITDEHSFIMLMVNANMRAYQRHLKKVLFFFKYLHIVSSEMWNPEFNCNCNFSHVTFTLGLWGRHSVWQVMPQNTNSSIKAVLMSAETLVQNVLAQCAASAAVILSSNRHIWYLWLHLCGRNTRTKRETLYGIVFWHYST